MAPKRSDPKDEPPAASSSEEEEETTSGTEEEETSEEEEEETQTTPTQINPSVKKPLIASTPSAATTATNVGNQSSESGESESDESETNSDSTIPHVTPIATKPIMEENTKSKQSAAKATASVAKSTAKRPTESKASQKETKRAKKDSENGEEGGKKTGDDVKKQAFQRVWSEEDEIALLKGMIEYSDMKGVDPTSDMNAFHEFIKKSLQLDCQKGKLMEKIRRLKTKYMANVKKGKEDGFAKPHEQESFKLSKRIWGNEEKSIVKAETPLKSKAKPKENQSLAALSSPDASKESKTNDIVPDMRIGVANLEEEVLSRGLDASRGKKKEELEERWRKLRVAELELFLERNNLVVDQAKLMLDYYKSANN